MTADPAQRQDAPPSAALDAETSLFLDLLRGGASIFVVLAHITLPRFSHGAVPWVSAHTAVIVFFVLSGYVVAYAARTRDRDLATYMVSRFSRLYSVVGPALLLSFFLAVVRILVIDGRVSLPPPVDLFADFALPFLYLNECWGIDVRSFDNQPIWSLPYEAWYYALFGVATYVRGRSRIVILATLVLASGPKIILYFPLWAMGALAYARGIKLKGRKGRLMFVSSGALLSICALAARLTHGPTPPLLPDGFTFLDYPAAAAVFGLIASATSLNLSLPRFRVAIRAVASRSFTLYLVHYPILLLVDAAEPDGPFAIKASLMLALVVAATIGMAQIAEFKRSGLRRWMTGQVNRLSRRNRLLVAAPPTREPRRGPAP